MTVLITLARRGGTALAVLLTAGPLAAQLAPQPARPASPPAAALATPGAVATGPWGLQRAIDYALAHNIGVRLNQLTVQSNAQVLRQSKAALLPTANLNATQAWQYGTSVNPLTFLFQNETVRSNNVSGNSQLVLLQGFQLRNTIRRNALDLQASEADVQKARNDLTLNVASAFLQAVLAQELVRANQFYVTRDQEQIARTKLLLQAGSIPESTLLDSQSQLATDELMCLACWRDAVERRVVGWHVSEPLHIDLILNAFNRAVAVCQPPLGLLGHADRGSQYTSDAFTSLLDRTQAIASLSRPGNPYDNALAERGWGTLKTELLPRGACFADLEEARLELAEYLDHYYNTQRLHPARSRTSLPFQPTLAPCPLAPDHLSTSRSGEKGQS